MEVDMNVLNGACAVLAITCFAAGCATSSPGADQVKVTTTLTDVEGCTLMGKVVVSDAKSARNETARLGGNVLLRKNDEAWSGNAYHCAAVAH